MYTRHTNQIVKKPSYYITTEVLQRDFGGHEAILDIPAIHMTSAIPRGAQDWLTESSQSRVS